MQAENTRAAAQGEDSRDLLKMQSCFHHENLIFLAKTDDRDIIQGSKLWGYEMSYADRVYIENCKRILSEGVWDTDQNVRPRWEDGTPAHTIKLFGVVNRYDLSKEFPIMTLRRTYWKSAIDELLWIWQKKSNNVHELGSRIWDSWADETG